MLFQLSYKAKSVQVCGISELSLVPSIPMCSTIMIFFFVCVLMLCTRVNINMIRTENIDYFYSFIYHFFPKSNGLLGMHISVCLSHMCHTLVNIEISKRLLFLANIV